MNKTRCDIAARSDALNSVLAKPGRSCRRDLVRVDEQPGRGPARRDTPPAVPATRPDRSLACTPAVQGPLARLGVDRLWGRDPERVWGFIGHVVPPVVNWLAPSFAYGTERLPTSGGAVLAGNHLSAIDPPLLGVFSRRSIYFAAKSEVLEIPIVGEALGWTGAFPIRRRESNRAALEQGIELARTGHIVGVHLEGTRQPFGHPGEMKPGGIFIALQAGVPIIPCGLETFGWTRRNRRACAIVYGEPISPDSIEPGPRRVRRTLEVVEAEIVRLWRLASEAVASGFPLELADGARRSRPVAPEARL